MINVEAVPSVLSRKSPEKVVRKVIDDLASLRKAGYDFKKAMAQSIACRAAVMSGDRLSDRELWAEAQGPWRDQMVALMNTAGAFPGRYWSQGTVDHWEAISGDRYHEEHEITPSACANAGPPLM